MKVTAVGGWPGTRARDAAAIVRDTCVDLPHLPEFPERGPGGEMVGRTMAMVSRVTDDFAVATSASGWQITSARGRDLMRADSYWDEDLDAVEETFTGYEGVFKVQMVGPLTLAASVEDRAGEWLLRDTGAVTELASALAHAWTDLIATMKRRIPGAQIVMQADEPLMAEVIAGRVKTRSEWSVHRSVSVADATTLLETVRASHSGDSVVHCCAKDVPFEVIRAAGFSAASFDLALVGANAADPVGQHLDAGGRVFLGIDPESVPAGVEAITRFGSRIGFSGREWTDRVVLTPPCDLLDMPLSAARGKMERLVEVANEVTQ